MTAPAMTVDFKLVPGSMCPECFAADGTLRCDCFVLIRGEPHGICSRHALSFPAPNKLLTPQPGIDDPAGFRRVIPVYVYAAVPTATHIREDNGPTTH